MSMTPRHSGPGGGEICSPDIFMPGISCNLESQFLNARDSIKEESMCVYARVRPMLPREEAKGFKECIAAVDEKTVRTVVPVNSSRYKNSRQNEEIVEDFSFNSAFGPESGQFVFFQETMLATMQNFVEGGNSLVFSYGITGSGKTYTLQGNSENPGIIPLSLRLYFAAVEKQLMKDIKVKPHMYNNIIALTAAQQKEEYYSKKELLSLYSDDCDTVPGSFRNSNSKTFAMTLCNLFSDGFDAEERQTTLNPEEMASAQAATYMKEVVRSSAENQLGVCNIWVSFVEIYNESIFDLLQPFTSDRKRLTLRECSGNVYIEGAREICVSNGDEALKVLNIGRKQLSIASTKMNYQSSRSHCIYTIRVVRVRDTKNLSTGRVNRLSFCDLAGSERVAKTQTTGMRLKEASSINSSLLVLGRCLQQLRMNQIGKDKRMIPFRDSKLTRLFSGFFMGHGKAVMIANASPCDYTYDETFHVLKFSALARKLKNNDTFFSEVSSTLQSICNEWSNTSNRSLCDESVNSVDSESDIIQKKDEIIEKLLVLAERLTRKEQEMEGMEMRIRQEIVQEYSEYTDQLLEDKRITYEEEMEAMRENYKRMIAKRDKMYEEIIENLTNQSEAVDSSEDTMNDSNSIVDLEKSITASPEKRLKLSICKDEKEKLSIECKNYQDDSSKALEVAKKYEFDIKDLEEQLSCLRKELTTTKELSQMKEFSFHEMESENEMLKTEVDSLKKEIHCLKDVIEGYDSDTKDYKAKIKVLEDRLLSSEMNYVSTKDQLHTQSNAASEIGKENEMLRSKVHMLEKEVNELKDVIERYEADGKDYVTKIGILEDKLLHNEKNYELAQEQLQIKLSSDSETVKENVELQHEVETLKEQIKDLKEVVEKYDLDSKNYESKICSLDEKLLCSEKYYEEQLKIKLGSASQLEKENVELQNESETLKKQIKDLKEVVEKYDLDFKNYESKICNLEEKLLYGEKYFEEQLKSKLSAASQLEKENVELQNELETLKKQIKDLKEVVEKYDLDSKNYESKICNLEEKLLCSEKYFEEQLKSKLSAASELERGIENFSQENEKLKKEVKELKENKLQDEEIKVNYKAKIHSLDDKLLFISKSYAEVKEELQNHSNASSELVKDLKSKIENLEKKIEELNKVNTKCKTTEEKYKTSVKFLEERLRSTQVNLDTAEEQREANSECISELEKEIETYKSEIASLKKNSSEASERLKEVMGENESKGQNFEQTISSLKNELKDASKELEKIFMHSKELLFETENKDCSKKDDFKVQRNYNEFSDSYSLFQSVTEKLTEKIYILQQELQAANKNIDLVKREMKVRESVSLELEKEIDMYKQEIDSLKQEMSKKVELEKKLLSLNQELEFENSHSEQISAKLNDLEIQNRMHESELIKLRKEQEAKNCGWEEQLCLIKKELESAKKDAEHKSSELESRNGMYEMKLVKLRKEQEDRNCEWEEQLSLTKKELETVKKDAEHRSSELESQNSAHELEVQRLKKQQQALEMELTEKLILANAELKAASDEIQQKSSKLHESQNLMNALKSEMEELKQSEQSLICEKRDLQEKFVLAEREIETLKNDVQQMSTHEQETRNQTDAYKEETDKLKKDYKNLQLEKRKVDEEVQCYKERIENFERNSSHVQRDDTATENLNKLGELEKEILKYKHDIKKMMDCQKLSDEEKQDLMVCISTNEEKIEDLEDQLTAANEKLQDAKDDILTKISAIEDLENRLADLYILLEIVEKCEAKASVKIEKLQTIMKKHNSLVLDLHCQIKNKESSIEQLEKALCDLQKQLKDFQRSCNQKLVSEKEQHEIEIEQALKLKHLVEEENMNLRKQKLKSDSKLKSVDTKNVDVKGKENFSRNTTTRALRKKIASVKDTSFSSTESISAEINKQKSRKRASDEDFEPCRERASKKMKSTESSKIPVKRTSRRKLQSEKTETLSPIQKITNSITSKVRVLSSNISSHISSPRLTRGRKRLFNPEATSSPLHEKVRKGKK